MKRLVAIGFLTGLVIFVSVLTISFTFTVTSIIDSLGTVTPEIPRGGTASLKNLNTFTSVEDFQAYIDKGDELASSGSSLGRGGDMISAPTADTGSLDKEESTNGNAALEPDRYSTTNVQVSGIDEPDIVKTDGSSIFFSKEQQYWIMEERTLPTDVMQGALEDSIMPPYYDTSKTRVIEAFPPENLKEVSSIDMAGDLLLVGNTLLVLKYNSVSAFNVASPSSPSQLWSYTSGSNTSIISSRLFEGTLYVITQQYTDYSTPCPIEPFLRDGSPVVTIRCTDIYHPTSYIDTDMTYTILKIAPETGRVVDSTSFVGSSSSSIIYMSPSSIYVTYTYQGDYAAILMDFLLENEDLLSASVVSKLRLIQTYNLSTEAKVVELTSILDKFQRSLSDDERTRVENELQNRMTTYMKVHNRELQLTGIVKIDQKTLDYIALGTVPGYLINQFALDEYNNNLRVATTVGGGWWWGFGGTAESANDVYVLNREMRTIGTLKDLGLTESIYSVRFIRETGYLVTFRQVDPFYVLDLSNPHSPRIAGELKIPGYSSYLHPISDTVILGVGQENWKVKLSLFDVSNPDLPQEVSKYTLEEGWTEVSSNHHAFMIDPVHKIFFLPGSNAGYVFSYEGNTLTLVTAVANIQARRAIYIDDYLYVIGDNQVVVLNENTWEKVKTLQFETTY